MKQKYFSLLLVLVLSVVTLSSSGQTISLEQLISLPNMDEADLNSLLENRGWDVAETTERNGTHTVLWSFGKCAQCVKAMYFVYPDAWSYKKTKYMVKEWIFLIDIGGVKYFKSVEYYTADRKRFLELRNRAVALCLKKIDYNNSDGRILYKFEGSNYQVSFVSLASGPKGGQNYVHVRQTRRQ